MMQIATTKSGLAMVVYNIGSDIHFTPLEKYDPNVLDARAPRFQGTLDECVDYVRNYL